MIDGHPAVYTDLILKQLFAAFKSEITALNDSNHTILFHSLQANRLKNQKSNFFQF